VVERAAAVVKLTASLTERYMLEGSGAAQDDEGEPETKGELMYFNDPKQLLVRAIYVYLYVYRCSYI